MASSTELSRDPPRDEQALAPPDSGSRRRDWLWLALPLLLAAWVHWPSLELGFAGDDFQWWQHARMAIGDPSLLLAPFGGYRPTNTWSLALNHLLFGADPWGYHATNLLLHLACGVLLFGVVRRLSLSAAAAVAVVALWACSPFSLEPVQWVNTRYNLVLLLAWMGLALLWPRPGSAWTPCRLAGAFALGGLSALTSESWVVLPGIVLAYELWLARAGLRRAVMSAFVAGAATVVYVALYFLRPPVDAKVYYAGGLAAVAKLPHAWAALSYLTTLRPLEFSIGVPEVVALVSMAALAWVAWRRRSTTIALGLALFLLPFLPVLPVGFMTTRYTAIPLVGFLIAVAGGVAEGRAALSPRQRVLATAATGTLALLALAANLAWLRSDLEDARSYSLANARLVAEARALVPLLRLEEPIVAVRQERTNLPAELAPASRGIPKIYYPRHGDPYSLADWGAVLSFVLDPTGGPILVKVAIEGQDGAPYQVIAHVDGGFVRLPGPADTARGAARQWLDRGVPVCVLAAWRTDRER